MKNYSQLIESKQLTEAANAKPYDLTMTKMDKSFVYSFEHSGTTLSVVIRSVNGLGRLARQVKLYSKTASGRSHPRALVGKISNPMRVIVTMIEAMQQYLKTAEGRKVHGFAVVFPRTTFGNNIAPIRKTIGQKMRRGFDPMAVLDIDFAPEGDPRAYAWLVRNGADPAEVFTGKLVTGVFSDGHLDPKAQKAVKSEPIDTMSNVVSKNMDLQMSEHLDWIRSLPKDENGAYMARTLGKTPAAIIQSHQLAKAGVISFELKTDPNGRKYQAITIAGEEPAQGHTEPEPTVDPVPAPEPEMPKAEYDPSGNWTWREMLMKGDRHFDGSRWIQTSTYKKDLDELVEAGLVRIGEMVNKTLQQVFVIGDEDEHGPRKISDDNWLSVSYQGRDNLQLDKWENYKILREGKSFWEIKIDGITTKVSKANGRLMGWKEGHSPEFEEEFKED